MADCVMICCDCEQTYKGGPNTYFCPECRRRRLSESAKRRNLGKIGREAYSKQQAERKKKTNEWK